MEPLASTKDTNAKEIAERIDDPSMNLRRHRRWTSLIILTLIILEATILYLRIRNHPFWYDELLTYYVSDLRPFPVLWHALYTGTDGMTPGYYAIVQLARLIPIDPRITLRIPSVLGFILALLGVYLFTKNRLPPQAAIASVLLLTLSMFRTTAIDARSYSLTVGLVAMAAAAWQRVDEKRWAKWLFAIALTLTVSSHYFAFLLIVPFAIAEITWTRYSHRIRWMLWGAFVLASSPFLCASPILFHFRQVMGTHFWSKPNWSALPLMYDFLGFGVKIKGALSLIILSALATGFARIWSRGKAQQHTRTKAFSVAEMVLICGILSYPAFLFTFTKIVNSGYTMRYGWPAVFSLVVILAYFLSFAPRWASNAVTAALSCIYLFQIGFELKRLQLDDSVLVYQRWARLSSDARTEPMVPVIVGSGLDYLEAYTYSPIELRSRLSEAVDPECAVRTIGTDSVDKANSLLAEYIPLNLIDRQHLEVEGARFLLYSGGPFDWVTQYFIENGYRLRLLSRDGGNALYIVDR